MSHEFSVLFVLLAMMCVVSLGLNDSSGTCEEYDAFSVLQRKAQPMEVNMRIQRKIADIVPKLIHHIYRTDLSEGPWPNTVWEHSFYAWKKWFPEPEYKHIFWDDAKTTSFVASDCPEFSKTFAAETRDIVRSDFSRYCILWKLGGIYADLDYMPLRNFYDDLKPGMVSLLQSPYHSETFQNALMASPPDNIYWEKLMNLARYTMKASNVLLAAGPQLLEILPLTRNASLIHTLPCNEFQRVTHDSSVEHGSAVEKDCKFLRPEDIEDESLKGIHWGTVSYEGTGVSTKGSLSKKEEHMGSLWWKVFNYARRPPRELGGVSLAVQQRRQAFASIFADVKKTHEAERGLLMQRALSIFSPGI
jgi:hypothetical protein